MLSSERNPLMNLAMCFSEAQPGQSLHFVFKSLSNLGQIYINLGVTSCPKPFVTSFDSLHRDFQAIIFGQIRPFGGWKDAEVRAVPSRQHLHAMRKAKKIDFKGSIEA